MLGRVLWALVSLGCVCGAVALVAVSLRNPGASLGLEMPAILLVFCALISGACAAGDDI